METKINLYYVIDKVLDTDYYEFLSEKIRIYSIANNKPKLEFEFELPPQIISFEHENFIKIIFKELEQRNYTNYELNLL